MESLISNKYRYEVGLTTVADPVSERFSSVISDDTLKQQGLYFFLRKEFALAVVDGSRLHSCTQSLTNVGEAGTELVSEPIA